MKKGGRFLRILFLMTIVFTVWTYSISAAEEKQPEKNGDIVILYTSDVHCAVDRGFGYAGLQQVREYLLSQGNEVILVDDGDSIRGDANGAITKGDAIINLMNRMGYSIAIPGNHEFDYGMDRFLSLADKADFDYISCNFTYKGEPVFKPWVMRELAGKKVAFVGVTTPKTITSSTPTYFQNEDGEYVYSFQQDATGEGVYNAVQTAVDSARAEGADYVVVMAHLGNESNCSPWTYKDVITHTSGIDAFLDGHSHDTDQVVVKDRDGKDVPRTACGTQMACVGWCRIAADGKISTGLYTWDNDVSAPQLLGIENDMTRAIAESNEELNEKLNEVVAATAVELTIHDPIEKDSKGKPVRVIRVAETNLGDLCADAFRDQSGADIAFINGGGVRTDIKAGNITLGNILNVLPFGNSLCMIEATGQQILDALEWGAREVPGEAGAFLQVSGLSYEIHSYIDSTCVSDVNGLFERVEGARRVKNVMVGDEPIDPEKTYTLAGQDYLLLDNGGGFTMFDGAPLLLDRVKLDSQSLIDYIADTLGGIIGEEYSDPYGQDRIGIVESAGETRIQMFETSDIHGYMMDTSSGDENTFQYRLAHIAQVVNNARTSGKYDDVILLDGGDIYQGMPVSNMTYGASMRAAFDAMHYDAVALGNHEFDWDVTEYCADRDGTLPPYQLGDYSGDPDIPVLASNLYYADTDERVSFTKDYAVVEKAGLRILLVGYVDDYSMTVMAEKIAPYRIDGNLDKLAARIREIKASENPDVTIVLCHCTPDRVAKALSPEEADLVAGGHLHNGVCGVTDRGVAYIQADATAKGYASATIVVGEDGSVRVEEPLYSSITEDKEALFDTPENAVRLDDTILDISHTAWSEISDEMGEVLGYIETPIEKKGYVADRETNGGNWITKLMLRKTEPEGVVAAFYNMKGIRANITIPEGETRHNLTVGDVYSLLPFNNTWLIYELTGPELAQQLVNGFMNTDYGDQVSGLTYEYINRGTDKKPDVEIVSITLNNGTKVDLNDTQTLYRVCTSNFNATLEGSVFLGKTPVVPEADAPIDNLTAIELLREEAEENEGRISVDTEPRGIRLEEVLDNAA